MILYILEQLHIVRSGHNNNIESVVYSSDGRKEAEYFLNYYRKKPRSCFLRVHIEKKTMLYRAREIR